MMKLRLCRRQEMQQITDPMAKVEKYADMVNEQLEMQKIPLERGKHSVRKKSLRPKWPRNRTCLVETNVTSMKPWATPSSDVGARCVSMVRDVKICTLGVRNDAHCQS